MVAADYPFLDLMWSMLIFFLWIAWLMILFQILIDIFRRHDASGFTKALWVIFVIFAPFLGVLVYLIINGHGMAERHMQRGAGQQAQFDDYVQNVAGWGGATAEIERAKGLLDSGAITQAEFDAIKAKALA